MINNKNINDMVQGIVDALPEGVKNLGQDIEGNVKSSVMAAFHKMDLVTREEFDAQAKVLQRTREKLESLQTKVSELEKKQSSTDR